MPALAEPRVLEHTLALADQLVECIQISLGFDQIIQGDLRLDSPGLENLLGHDPVALGIGMHAVLGEEEGGIHHAALAQRVIHGTVDVDDVPAILAFADEHSL